MELWQLVLLELLSSLPPLVAGGPRTPAQESLSLLSLALELKRVRLIGFRGGGCLSLGRAARSPCLPSRGARCLGVLGMGHVGCREGKEPWMDRNK